MAHKRPEWTDAEIIDALHDWRRRHGALPTYGAWETATEEHPAARTVVRRKAWGSWHGFLAAALEVPEDEVKDLMRWEMRPGVLRRPRAEIEKALRTAGAGLGRPPAFSEWTRASADRPTSKSVARRLGGWTQGLLSVGLELPAPGRSAGFLGAIARRRAAGAGAQPRVPAVFTSAAVQTRLGELGFGGVADYMRDRYLGRFWSPLLIARELGVSENTGDGPVQRALAALGIPRGGWSEAQRARVLRLGTLEGPPEGRPAKVERGQRPHGELGAV